VSVLYTGVCVWGVGQGGRGVGWGMGQVGGGVGF
jgi:hypothetical protein